MDTGDKGTSKVMLAAFKYAAMQTLCIPVAGEFDSDASTPPKLLVCNHPPVEGWARWVADLPFVIASCQTHESLDRAQAIHREQLRSLSKVEPGLYAQIGDAIAERRVGISKPWREAA